MSEQAKVPVRRRSSHYYGARDALFKVLDIGSDKSDLRVVETFFDNWRAEYDVKKYVRLRDGDEYVFVRMVNRFCDEYRRKVWSKMDHFHSLEWDLMITLTLDPKMFLNLGLEYVKLPPAWNRLKTALNWSYGKFEFVRVVEAQKTGRPHLHVLIKFHEWRGYYNRKVNGKRVQYMCEKPFIPQDHLAELWRNAVGGNGTAYVTSCTDNVNAVWYVVKYVRKSIAELWYGSLLFASNKRLWSVSRGLRDILRVRRYDSGLPPRFHYDGSCYLSELKSYLDDVGIGVSDFVKVTPSNDALSIYEDVFGTWEGG